MLRALRSCAWLLGVIAIASFIMLWRLDARPYENWDEAIHGEVSFEMLERGDWLTPSYTNAPYFRKPPLKLWMSAALFEWFGVNPWMLRLPSAVAGILVALLTAWWMWEWRRSKLAAFLAGTIVATIPAVHHHAFRTGEMDGLLALFVVLALYAYGKGTRGTQRWFVVSGVAIGLGVMTKSVAGLIPLPIIAIDFFLHRRWRGTEWKSIALAKLAFVAVVLPWHLVMSLRHGMAFWDTYLGWHVIKRIAVPLHNETAGFWYYVPMLWNRFEPYSWWLIPAIALVMIKLRSKKTVGREDQMGTPVLLLLWTVIVFAGFTFAKTKFDWYLLPLYPAAALLVAWTIDELLRRSPNRPFRLGAQLLLVVTLGFAALSTIRHLIPTYPQPPFSTISAALEQHGANGLVAHGFQWRDAPAAYFSIHTTLPNVRLSDGLTDVERTLEKLALKERSMLITKQPAELPKELRGLTGDPQSINDAYTLYTWIMSRSEQLQR